MMYPLLALLFSLPISADDLPATFNIVRFEVCDSQAYKEAVGASLEYFYIPWIGLGTSVLSKDPRYKDCSMMRLGGYKYHVLGSPSHLIKELESYGVNVILLDLPDDGGAAPESTNK